MHESFNYRILAEAANGYIGECPCCHEFNFAYKNILLVFAEEEMCRFLEWIIECKFSPDTYQPLPHGRDRVYCSPLSNLYLTFSEDEIDEIDGLLAQVRLVLEARRILSGKEM